MTIVEERQAHRERAARVVGLYEKLLVLRLVHLAQSLGSEVPERPERARFVDRWSSLERMNPEGLQRAARDPHLTAWVATGEELIRNGIYQRYPDAHPKRHLDGFGRLLLSWAQQLPDGSHGQVELAGQPAVDLMFGDVVLLGPFRDAHRTLSWRTRGGVLRVGWSDAEPIVEASLGAADAVELARDDWQCFRKPRGATIPIDVWTWPRLDNDRPPVDPDGLRDALEQAWAGVPSALQPLIHSTCRAVTAGASGGRWIAGLLSLREGATPGSRELLELACFDLVSRLVYIQSASEALDLPKPVLVELARRMAARWLGEDAEAGFDPETKGRWGALLSALRETGAGRTLFEEIDEVGAAVQLSDAPPVPPAPDAPHLLLPLSDAAAAQMPQRLQLKKTRERGASNVNDFTALNGLSYLSEPALREVLEQALGAAGESEGAAYLAAAAAYVLGEFPLCVQTLARCIRFDPDVEEYWHLLAFALRFLKRYGEFDRILFDGDRSADLLERLEPALASTS